MATIIPKAPKLSTTTVVSVFDVRKRQYERALEAFNSYVPRGSGYDINDIIEEELLLCAAVECQSALLATPTSALADVAFKIQQSRDELDEFSDDDGAVALLDSAIAALQAGNPSEAIRAIEGAIGAVSIDHADAFLEGAIAALGDLRRKEGAK